MKRTIIRAYTIEYAAIALATRPGVVELARDNGCELAEYLIEAPGYKHPSWCKLDFVIDALERGELVTWMDADIAAVPGVPKWLRKIDVDNLRFSQDSNGICAGFFSAHGAYALDLLKMVRFLGNSHRTPAMHEQDTIKVLMENFGSVCGRIDRYAATTVTCPENESSIDSYTIAHHFWANAWPDKQALADHIKAWLQARGFPAS